MSRIASIALVVAAAAAAPLRAAAHDLWLERAGETFVLRSGHRGGAMVPVDSAKVLAIRCASGAGPRDLRPGAVAAEGALRVTGRCDAASAVVDHGFFVLTPDGERNVPRTQASDAVKAWRSRQWAKWVDARSAAAVAPLGDALELVPATDLARARVGGKVTIRVLLDGKPAAGAVVAIGHDALAETGSNGEARVRVRESPETISATLRRPLRSAEADVEVLEASLTFEAGR